MFLVRCSWFLVFLVRCSWCKIEIRNFFLKLESVLTYQDCKDIDGLELSEEIWRLSEILPKKVIPLNCLNYIFESGLTDLFPNVWIALRIMLTLPVSVASAERSFSRLKLIKTYLRSNMGQERLSGLAIISIENEISSQMDYSRLIDLFAKEKLEKSNFDFSLTIST